MDEKLDAALFLESPQRILEQREWHTFRLHGMVVKYVKIYQSRADRKQLRVVVSGDSWGEIHGNSRALGIIPHTLIDNAIKYAPDGSRIDLDFEEKGQAVSLAVSSLGPRISSNEQDKIFDLFYRGEAAREKSGEGTGFGLASAQNIARFHQTEIVCTQSARAEKGGHFRTKFEITFPIARQGTSKEDSAASGKGQRGRGRGTGRM
jgi:signal transduction histidine kinase